MRRFQDEVLSCSPLKKNQLQKDFCSNHRYSREINSLTGTVIMGMGQTDAKDQQAYCASRKVDTNHKLRQR